MKPFFKQGYCLIAFLFLAASCQREINWYFKATGTLKDAQGNCMSANVSGVLFEGRSPNDENFIELQVNVFTRGTYSISTDVQNGLSFADSGTFNNTGLQTIRLKPTGTPITNKPANFTICFDTSCCPVTVDVKHLATDDDDKDNWWSYTDAKSGKKYSGKINATHYLITPLSTLVSLRREVTEPTDTSFEVGIAYPTPVITTGSFKTDSLNEVALSTGGRCVNCAWEVMYRFYGVLTTIVVTSYDPQTKIIKGTFSGTSIDWQNNIAPIKDGKFSAVIK